MQATQTREERINDPQLFVHPGDFMATEIAGVVGVTSQIAGIVLSGRFELQGKIEFSDISDMFDSKGRILPLAKITPHTRRAIASYKVRRRTRTLNSPNAKMVTETVKLISVRLHPKILALCALGRYLGMFREHQAPTLDRTPVIVRLGSKNVGRSR